jgi:hypothetical protein
LSEHVGSVVGLLGGRANSSHGQGHGHKTLGELEHWLSGGLGLMRRKQSIILPDGNALVKDFVIWLTIDHFCIARGIQHNYHTIGRVESIRPPFHAANV